MENIGKSWNSLVSLLYRYVGSEVYSMKKIDIECICLKDVVRTKLAALEVDSERSLDLLERYNSRDVQF